MMRFLPFSVDRNERKSKDRNKESGKEKLIDEIVLDTGTDSDEIFDRKTALEQMDGDKRLLEQYVEICQEDITEELAKIEQAANIDDFVSIGVCAHTIKGMAGTMGAKRLYEIALEMEKAQKDYDADKTRLLFKRLEEEYANFLYAYKCHLT